MAINGVPLIHKIILLKVDKIFYENTFQMPLCLFMKNFMSSG